MTLSKGRTISGVEMLFVYFAIEQVKRPLRKLRRSRTCWLCKKEIPVGEMAYGDGMRWHEMCALGLASFMKDGIDAILANGHYRVIEESVDRMVIQPVRDAA